MPYIKWNVFGIIDVEIFGQGHRKSSILVPQKSTLAITHPRNEARGRTTCRDRGWVGNGGGACAVLYSRGWAATALAPCLPVSLINKTNSYLHCPSCV